MSCHFDDLPSHQKVCCLSSCFSAAWSEIFLFWLNFPLFTVCFKCKGQTLIVTQLSLCTMKAQPNLSICSPVHSPICLSNVTSVHLLISQSLHLSICQLVQLFICSFIHLALQVCICSSVNQSKFTSVNLSTGPTVYLFIHPFARPSLHLFIC